MYLSYPCRDALKIEDKTLYFVTFAYCCYVNYLDCGTVGAGSSYLDFLFGDVGTAGAAICSIYSVTPGLREQHLKM